MPVQLLISKPTKNALTETSPNSFYLHSDYPLLKVHASGTFSRNVALMPLDITHSLGYKPYVLAFSKYVDYDFGTFSPIISTREYQHDWLQEGASNSWWGYTKIYANKLQVNVGQTNVFSGVTVTGFYYIFKDEI